MGKTDYSVDSLNKVLKNVDVIIHLAATREYHDDFDYHADKDCY